MAVSNGEANELCGVERVSRAFGLENKANIKLAQTALKAAEPEISYTTDSNAGITYFYFDSAATLRRAVRAVKDKIDVSKESE